jgi:protein-S-isoprenylcysteine O-methyltransferase Ste14
MYATHQTEQSLLAYFSSVSSWLIRRRVPISAVFCTILITTEVLLGYQPSQLWSTNSILGWTSVGIVLLGLFIRSWAAGTLNKNRHLTMTGPYRICRHPLYLGSLLMMLGFCLLFCPIWNIPMLFVSMSIIYTQSIRFEDRLMYSYFGHEWEQFRDTTRALIPHLRIESTAFTDWSAQQWFKNREYQAVFGTMIALTAILVWSYRLAG